MFRMQLGAAQRPIGNSLYNQYPIKMFATSVHTEENVEEIRTETQPLTDAQLRRQRVKTVLERYPGLKIKDVPHKLAHMDLDEIKELEKQACKEFGFVKEEIRFVMKHKPSFLLWQD